VCPPPDKPESVMRVMTTTAKTSTKAVCLSVEEKRTAIRVSQGGSPCLLAENQLEAVQVGCMLPETA